MFTDILLLLATGDDPDKHASLQKALLELTFRHTYGQFANLLSFEIPFQDIDLREPVGWGEQKEKRVHLNFFDGELRRLVLYHWIFSDSFGNLDIEFLPNSVEHLTIRTCGQSYAMNTRYLPRESQFIEFVANKLTGDLDLQSLPRKLVRLDLRHNRFQGPISLFDLSPELKVINLVGNRLLGCETVYYGKLPASMNKIFIGGTSMKSAEAVSKEHENRQVFSFKKLK